VDNQTHSKPAELSSISDILPRGNFSETFFRSLLIEGCFPPPVITRKRFVRWKTSDVDRWFASPSSWAASTTNKAA
jgi:predicted DNA-binding transcriptional regulator AlpA